MTPRLGVSVVACAWCGGRGVVFETPLCSACQVFQRAWGEPPSCIHCTEGEGRSIPCAMCGGCGWVSAHDEKTLPDLPGLCRSL